MGRAEAAVASQISRAVLTIAHRLPNAKVIDFASFVTIYGGVWNILHYCFDCTFLRPSSGHGPVMVLFLSVYLYGTIISYPYIYTGQLLPIITFVRRNLWNLNNRIFVFGE